MAEPLRHRQTKEAETDMPGLPPPRHIPTLPKAVLCAKYQDLFMGLSQLISKTFFCKNPTRNCQAQPS